ncbi:MAG: hypothetical protein IPQ09_15390 [Myxococcales bacterium]|nr:hypothetical protein [Myxococcales bacterium]
MALAEAGHHVLTYGDMLRVPGRARSLDDARAAGARVDVLYAATQAAGGSPRERPPRRVLLPPASRPWDFFGTIEAPFSAHRYRDFQSRLSHVMLAQGRARSSGR